VVELDHTPALAAGDAGGPRRSLILAGGGMRVAYQAGVLRALEEEGLRFAHADGTSGGTINLAMLLSGRSPEEMCERWRTLHVRDFVSLLPLRQYLRGANAIAFGDADGLVRKVYPHLGIDVARIRAARGIAGTFNVCNFAEKTNEAVPHTEIDLDLLVAGVSLPVFMPPVRKGDVVYTDSVWIKDANLTEAVRRGSEELWLVWCIGNGAHFRSGVFNEYVHMIELSANGGLGEELAHLRDGWSAARLHVIKPEYPLPLDPDFYRGRIDAHALVAMGYRDAKTYLAARSDEGVPWTAAATRMRDPGLGIAFAERLTGSVRDERGAASELSLRLRAGIRDLGRFRSDGTGDLVGVIDSPELGRGLLAKRGSLRADAGRLRYELVFEAAGRELTLTLTSGDRPWSRVARAAATLVDATGVRSGELRAGPLAVVAALLRLHATWAESLRERFAAHVRAARLLLRAR
jgi:predicted acylesterase/phospholipase RssA